MRKKKTLLQMESDYLQIEEAEDIINTNTKQIEIEQEIECPRCHDIMILSSEFDRFGYFCDECSFLLYLS
jgi:hypothetical protein